MQEIIVAIIVLACVLLIIRRIIQYVKRINRNENICDGCCGCDLSKKKKKIEEKSNGKFGDSKNNCTFASAIEKQR